MLCMLIMVIITIHGIHDIVPAIIANAIYKIEPNIHMQQSLLEPIFIIVYFMVNDC
jgi:hypothetical protein